MTAIQSADCQAFWVLTVVQLGSDAGGVVTVGTGVLQVFRVDVSGFQHHANFAIAEQVSDLGYLKASSDGARLAMANWRQQNVLLWDFDNVNGAVSNLTTISTPATIPAGHAREVYGVEFSPDSNVLYFTVVAGISGTGYVAQVDLHNNSVSAPLEVGQHPSDSDRYALGTVQLAIDGRHRSMINNLGPA